MEIKAPQAIIREKARQELKSAIHTIQKNFGIEPDMMCDMLKSITEEYQEQKASALANLALSIILENTKEENEDDNTKD
jgi:hypothetical protein